MGVACYYGWVGACTPENARAALQAREMAQQIIAAAQEMQAAPRFMDIELFRTAPEAVRQQPEGQDILRRFPKDSIACTLDFIETDQGMMLLEGGPAHTPLGGGHPCAFAGFETSRRGICKTEGIALRLIDGVCLGNPASWMGRKNDGAILTLEEAQELAEIRSETDGPGM